MLNLNSGVNNFPSVQLISNQEDDGLETLLTLLEKEKGDYTIGDTLHVQGKLSFYKEEWKIFGNTIRRYFIKSSKHQGFYHKSTLGAVEFEEENHRCLELDHLYKNIYKTK